MARFVIADVTGYKIVPEEIPHIVRNVAVPLKPILLKGRREPITLRNLRKGHLSLMDTFQYEKSSDILKSLKKKIIIPAEAKAEELKERDK